MGLGRARSASHPRCPLWHHPGVPVLPPGRTRSLRLPRGQGKEPPVYLQGPDGEPPGSPPQQLLPGLHEPAEPVSTGGSGGLGAVPGAELPFPARCHWSWSAQAGAAPGRRWRSTGAAASATARGTPATAPGSLVRGLQGRASLSTSCPCVPPLGQCARWGGGQPAPSCWGAPLPLLGWALVSPQRGGAVPGAALARPRHLLLCPPSLAVPRERRLCPGRPRLHPVPLRQPLPRLQVPARGGCPGGPRDGTPPQDGPVGRAEPLTPVSPCRAPSPSCPSAPSWGP